MDTWLDDTEEAGEELTDFSFGGKDALIFLIDASPVMHEALDSDGEEAECGLSMALKCVVACLRSKVFNAPNDLVGVLLYGTKNQVGCRDFKNLSILLPLETAEATSILKVEELADNLEEKFDDEFGKSEDFSLHEALWQCQSLFANATGKIGQKKILLISSDDDPHGSNPQKKRQAMQKARDLHDTGAYLDVLPIGTGFKMDKFFRDLIQLADDEAVEVFNPVEKLEDLNKVVRKRIHKKRSNGKIHFDLGNGVKISVASYNLAQKAYKPTKVKLAKDTNEEVKTQRNFINPRTGAPLLPSDINKFQEYGGKKIKFTQDEVKSVVMMDGELGLRLLGFKPLSSLKWSQFVKASNFLYPEEKMIQGSRNLFAALLIKCLERKVVAVCSCKSRDTSGPSFVALVPQAEDRDEDRPPGFHLVYLPFADDLRNVPAVKFAEPEPEQLSAAKKMINKLKMKTYHPEAFENPDLQAHYSLIESLALARDDVVMGEDTTLPPVERIKTQLAKNDVGKEFLEAVYPDGYNPEAAASAATKRKAPAAKREPAAKKANDTTDMSQHVKDKTVEKLTVAVLKDYLGSIGINVGKMKKAELVAEVYSKSGKK